MPNIFIIEDNIQMQKYISDFLEIQDYQVRIIDDYDLIVDEINIFEPDLILLDINLPKYDGFFYLKLIKKHFNIPVIILSARSDESEQVRGIENGAVDYITKPFSINVLLAKINAMLKNNQVNKNILKYEGLLLDGSNFKISYADKSIELTKNEYKILQLLVSNVNEIVSRNDLLEHLWDESSFVDDNTLTVNMTRVKKKLSEIGLKDSIVSKRGVGYLFCID